VTGLAGTRFISEEGQMSSTGSRAALKVFVGAIALLVLAAPAHAEGTVEPVAKVGTVDYRTVVRNARPRPARPELRNSPAQVEWREFEERRFEGQGAALTAPTSLTPPSVAGSGVVIDPIQEGFEGEDIQDTVFTNGSEVEPPDQGLCGGTVEGTTYLFESVNLSIALYDTTTSKLTPSVDLNSFFGQAPVFDPDTERYGPFLSDPKCYFDPVLRRWYHTVLLLGVRPKTGDFNGKAATLIAASTSSDPLGTYNLYSIDASDPGGEGCPCFGDQPLLGADRRGLYVSTAEYGIDTDAFHGAQIFALDKVALATGSGGNVVHIDTGTQKTGTVQPATSPNGGYETALGGTEYFLAAFDCEPPDCHVDADSLENTIEIFALTHTDSIRTANPQLKLSSKLLPSETYGQPVPQRQKPGFHPYGASLGEPVPKVESNDARMNQVVFTGGRLWSGLTTIVRPGPRDGIAWFEVQPLLALQKDQVSGEIKQQGYLATADTGGFLSFPSVGVSDAGRGVIAYSLMGDRYWPSTAWTGIDRQGLTTNVRVAQPGAKPEDGFSCYPNDEFLCRWGDYTASFALPDGTVWSATEFIGNQRTTYANWSTFVFPVKP
jgi:hypothetical protein